MLKALLLYCISRIMNGLERSGLCNVSTCRLPMKHWRLTAHSARTSWNESEKIKKQKLKAKKGGLSRSLIQIKTLSFSFSIHHRHALQKWRAVWRTLYGQRWSRCVWSATERLRSMSRRWTLSRRRFCSHWSQSRPKHEQPSKINVRIWFHFRSMSIINVLVVAFAICVKLGFIELRFKDFISLIFWTSDF